MRTALQRHPVSSYFIFAYLVLWGGSALVLGPDYLGGEIFQIPDLVYGLLVMLAGPSLSGLFMTWVCDGKQGLTELFIRMRRWRVSWRWYAAAIFVFPLVTLGVLLLFSVPITPEFRPGFLRLGIIYGLMAGFIEEIGWTGFAYPRMQEQRNALSAAILLGVLHGLWHIVADFLGSSSTQGTLWLPHLPHHVGRRDGGYARHPFLDLH